MKFQPVETLEELDSLNIEDVKRGYVLGLHKAPEPKENKALWHGWRNGMIDKKHLQGDEAYYKLARLIINREKNK